MILGPVSLLDTVVFFIYLNYQLLKQVGLFPIAIVGIKSLPFLFFTLPIQVFLDRYWTGSTSKFAHSRRSTLFEDITVLYTRYATNYMPTRVNRVIFSKEVMLPFLKWRMMRHGLKEFPVHWREQVIEKGENKVKGVWIMHEPEQDPDIVIYYVHGGGYQLGSSYFYLEFLLAWYQLLVDAGFNNPAIFALDYTLAPEKVYPTQVHEALQGYRHVLDVARDASKVCFAGDSAGGNLLLGLLLKLGLQAQSQQENRVKEGAEKDIEDGLLPTLARPRMATLISPWVTLLSNLHRPSKVDYVTTSVLWKYAHDYVRDSTLHQQVASPGSCHDIQLWKAASPERGYFITYGREEVLAPDIESFAQRLDAEKIEVEAWRTDVNVHAWPVISLLLSSTRQERLHGLRTIVGEIRKRFDKSVVGEK